MQITRATREDLVEILAIINDQIDHGYAHFGTQHMTSDELEAQWAASEHTHPWLVAHADDNTFLGFAKAGPWNPREGYRWTVGVSVYLCNHARGRGIGRALYDVLFRILKDQGYLIVYAWIGLPNDASERLHQSMGMSVIGDGAPAGYKEGRWVTVRYYQMVLGDLHDSIAPEPVRLVSDVYPDRALER